MKKIAVKLGKRSYEVVIGHGILSNLAAYIKKLDLGENAIIITNPQIKRIIGPRLTKILRRAKVSFRFETVPDSERSKSQNVAFKLIDRVSCFAKSKRVFIIALGGGVVGDLAGFVASLYKRGIPYIQIPTTLLAQIDSAIGGKVGIDLACGKNLVGAFYQPRLVLCDIFLLQTLPKRQIINGLAEAVKYGLIKDKALLEYIEENYRDILALNEEKLGYIVNKCVLIKANIVSRDEKETKRIRTILNFGHTIAHALETAGGFKLYSHGEAVGLGMLAAVEISSALGLLTSQDLFRRIKNLFNNIGLAVKIKGLNLEKIIRAQSFDKKFTRGRNRFVLLRKIGETTVKENIAPAIVRRALEKIM